LTFSTCSIQKNVNSSESAKANNDLIQTAIDKYLGGNLEFNTIRNDTKELELYFTDNSQNKYITQTKISLFVYSILNKKVIYNNTFMSSTIKWHDNENLLLTTYKGIIDNNSNNNISNNNISNTNISKYIININTGQIRNYETIIK
jgi:hypothetical protein